MACSSKILALVVFLGLSRLPLAALDLQEDVANTPLPPQWSAFVEKLPFLGRRLQIASPCVGIHGCGHAVMSMGAPADSINVFDLQSGYSTYLHKHLTDMGMDRIQLNLGRALGDLLNFDFTTLQKPVDFLVSGPPCPPWAGQGKRCSLSDPRAKVFLRILQWVVYFIKCAGLIGVILENVVGIRTRREGRESVMDIFERALNKWCPEFCWRVDQLALVEYMCPQSRVRVFLRGMRRCIASPCPPCLKPFGSRFLRSCLGKFGHTPRSSLCENQQQNLIYMEAKIRQQVLDGKLQLEDVVVVSVDRGPGLTYPQTISVNVAPTFTTSNSSLFVWSVRGVADKTPDDQREFFRKFRNSERLALQGFPPDIVFQLSPELAMFAAGNAYPVPLIIATLHPMLHALSLSKVNLASWPPAELLLPGVPDCLDKFTKDSLKKPRLLKGAKGPVKKRARSKSAEDSD